ncbi:MAG: zinc-ribbon domain-containing protein, partial [Candidatus Muiribacteriota bacterium]
VEDKEGNFWKIDEEYENWLFYDRKNNEWIEKTPPEENHENKKTSDTVSSYVTEIQIPSSPVLPENLKKFCKECGNKIEFDHKFCTKCGTKI